MTRSRKQVTRFLVFVITSGFAVNAITATMDLGKATLVVATGPRPAAEKMAAQILTEEVAKRTGIQWPTDTKWPRTGPVIALVNETAKPVWKNKPLSSVKIAAEGFRIVMTQENGFPVVWILARDQRGLLFGAGKLLRSLIMSPLKIELDDEFSITTAPVDAIRGHQLGYRSAANSYDAWTEQQYEQYIRELAIFGSNCIENIPFQDDQPSRHMKMTRNEMNRKLSAICSRYDLDHWVWTPAVIDLTDSTKRQAELEKHEQFYRDCPRLDAVFFPGGDPGDNHPREVLPFLRALSIRLKKYHPHAGIWISLQGFDDQQVLFFFDFVNKNLPDWLAGVVTGPSSPSIEWTRTILPAKYRHRHYPDITHTVRCESPVEWWDQAFALTLGREPINPRPSFSAKLHNQTAPFTDGFLSYSDGAHDDINKIVWTMAGWDPTVTVREILVEYSRFFFGQEVAESAADGILALERNWVGGLDDNGCVETTLSHWQALTRQAPQLQNNWRWQMNQLRSIYDAYTRRRMLYEERLEQQAVTLLAQAKVLGSDKAMNQAMAKINQADTRPVHQELRRQISDLCDSLFHSIGLQTSVNRYHASGSERGCILDFVDYPLNNRWWYEDQFEKIRQMTPDAQQQRLRVLATWDNPGPGSFYDNIANIRHSPHVDYSKESALDYGWWESGLSRLRLSSQVYMEQPEISYATLDPKASYLVRVTGYGEALLRINGQRVEPTLYQKEIEGFKEFPVPQELLADGKLVITWDKPNEEHLNWRRRSRISDVWLLKQ